MTMTGKTIESIAKGSTGKVLAKDGKTYEVHNLFLAVSANKHVAFVQDGDSCEIIACEC